jgi:AbrB family looped-hinge helix DNA binding protein
LTGITFQGITFAVKVTIKGQVTIPRDIREAAGMRPGTEVEFIRREGEVIVRPKMSRKEALAAVIKRSRGTALAGLTTAGIMKLTRGED